MIRHSTIKSYLPGSAKFLASFFMLPVVLHVDPEINDCLLLVSSPESNVTSRT